MKCVGCGYEFKIGLVSIKGETQHHTSLYGCKEGQYLCESCNTFEENQMEEKGTNNIPELLKQYSNSSYSGEAL